MSNTNINFISIFSGFFIGLGLAVAGYFVSQTTLNERTGANTAHVKGLSERIVPADNANWSLVSSVTSRDFDNVATAFATAENQANRIQDILLTAGFDKNEIVLAPFRKNITIIRNREQEEIDRYYYINVARPQHN